MRLTAYLVVLALAFHPPIGAIAQNATAQDDEDDDPPPAGLVVDSPVSGVGDGIAEAGFGAAFVSLVLILLSGGGGTTTTTTTTTNPPE